MQQGIKNGLKPLKRNVTSTQAASRNKKGGRTEAQLRLAQYFTPSAIADYMSSLFADPSGKKISLLDPGAGEGILGLNLISRLSASSKIQNATFVELDEPTSRVLANNLKVVDSVVATRLINEDFIVAGLELEAAGSLFTHIMLNPPYFKLRVDSENSVLLRRHGIQVTNIYAAFVWLSARLLEKNGELVAIIPRSFCNGPYFLKFRQYLTDNFSLDTIHIFSSRNKAFARDNVLQENIILHISRRKQVETIKITYSTDQSFSDIAVKELSAEMVVEPGDDSRTIHIPSEKQTRSLTDYLSGSIQDLDIMASTGPIVDFRLKDNILPNPTKDSVPLLYPAHMSGHEVDWPLTAFNKIGQYYTPGDAGSNRLPLPGVDLAPVDRNILPLDGFYVVIRRFSSKEEKRRIFASVVSPDRFTSSGITFENHLNYFHAKKHGFDKDLAYGLCAYLNSSVLDEHFRKISGHTQVNVSDLKKFPYPNQKTLRKIGAIMQNIDSLMDDIVTKEIMGVMK